MHLETDFFTSLSAVRDRLAVAGGFFFGLALIRDICVNIIAQSKQCEK